MEAMEKKSAPTQLRTQRASIKKDTIHPKEYQRYPLVSSCEDCSHFSERQKACTFGYNSANHLRNRQNHDYEVGGKMAFCRFLEID